jgi:hypothetical protein
MASAARTQVKRASACLRCSMSRQTIGVKRIKQAVMAGTAWASAL